MPLTLTHERDGWRIDKRLARERGMVEIFTHWFALDIGYREVIPSEGTIVEKFPTPIHLAFIPGHRPVTRRLRRWVMYWAGN